LDYTYADVAGMVDHALLAHQTQDEIASLTGGLGMNARVMATGTLNHPGNQRRSGQVEFAYVRSEVEP